MKHEERKFIDVHAKTSGREGALGWLETVFRSFRTLGFSLTLVPIAFFYVLCMGISLTPGMMLMTAAYDWARDFPFLIKNFALASALSLSFLSYGLTLIFVVPLVNLPILHKVRPHRASWFSLSVIPWYYHNALTYLVRYTFLDLITPTPLNKLFYQMMGMKIGKGSMINTSNISDPCLIEIGDHVTIGGSVTMVAHYGQKGLLVIEKIVIHDEVTIGLKASVFGDVVIGKGAMVKPHEVVLPKSRVPAKEESLAA
jgi:hypothetical protein